MKLGCTFVTQEFCMREMQGIVIRTTRYGENSVIAELLTAEEGSLTVIAGGLRSKRGRAHAALLKTGTPVSVILYFKPGANMHRLKEAHAGYRLQSIPFSIVKSSVLLFLIDVGRSAFQAYSENERSYQFLMDHISELDQRSEQLGRVPIEFMMNLSQHLGFGPAFDQDENPGYFDLRQGIFTPTLPAHHNVLSEQDAQDFWLLGRHLRHASTAPDIGRHTRQRLLDALILFFRLHIEQFKVPKSHEVLAQLFHPPQKS
jgi:DNA repair protein RecO (recombination protein O)